MPAKKKSARGAPARPKSTKKTRPDVLPGTPEVPGVPLNLEVYEVAGLLWENASNDLSLLNCTDLEATAARVKPEMAAKVMKFLTSTLDVQNSKEDGKWTCERSLGAGAFGRVAFLVKKAPDGQVIDSLALKEADHKWTGREATPGEKNLPIEVAINRDVNTHDAVHTAYLRGYKYGKHTKRGRLYLRHYKYGDLALLHKAYIVYGHWLPEWFIYEVIDKDSGEMCDLSFFKTIHQDIKPKNAFLDQVVLDKDVYKGLPNRPVSVLADYGEADYTNEGDLRNPKSFYTGGTPGYKPPEELRVKSYMARFGDRGTPRGQKQNLKPLAATANNVWGIGRTVFELMTHIGGTDFGWALKIMHGAANPGESYEGFVATEPFSSKLKDWQEVLELCVHAQLKDSFPYSDHLRELIADMLHPNQYQRPTIPEIERRALKGLDTALAITNNQYKDVVDKNGKTSQRSC